MDSLLLSNMSAMDYKPILLALSLGKQYAIMSYNNTFTT